MRESFEKILVDESWPLEIRSFIFRGKVKNSFLYTEPVIDGTRVPSQYLKTLYFLLKTLDSNLRFRVIQLQTIANFLEDNFVKKCDFRECLISNDQKSRAIVHILWKILAEEPMNVLDSQTSYWTKRIYSVIFFGSTVPLTLEFEQN